MEDPPEAFGTPPPDGAEEQGATVTDAADRILGGITILVSATAFLLAFRGYTSYWTAYLLASIPLINLPLSQLAARIGVIRVNVIRGLICVPVCAYIYAASDGAFQHWWIAAFVMTIGQCVIVCVTTRSFAIGAAITGSYTTSLVVASWITFGTANLDQSLEHALGIGLAGLLFSLTASRLGRAMERMQRINEKLAESERRLSESSDELVQFLQCVPHGLFVVDANGKPTYANAEAERLLGTQTTRYVDDEANELLLRGTDEPCASEQRPMMRALAGESVAAQPLDVIADGVRVHLSVKAAPIFDSEGLVAYALGTFEDITDELAAERQRLQGQKLESVGQLAAGVAHEINTPMQYIGDNARFLQKALTNMMKFLEVHEETLKSLAGFMEGASGLAAVEEAAKKLKVARLRKRIPKALESTIDGVQTVSTIVLAMKEFSHPGSDTMAPADLNHAIETALTVSRNEWKYAADVETSLAPNLPLVPCLLGELNQVFLNIVVNATHAIADAKEREGLDGTEKGTIRIVSSLDGDHAQIMFSDDGCGIPETIRSRIYDPFFTTKDVGRGTGQGLAIARSVIVEKHRGTLDLQSEVGKGTTFTIRLPLEQASTHQDAA